MLSTVLEYRRGTATLPGKGRGRLLNEGVMKLEMHPKYLGVMGMVREANPNQMQCEKHEDSK